VNAQKITAGYREPIAGNGKTWAQKKEHKCSESAIDRATTDKELHYSFLLRLSGL
jgi:hypothetical protein